MENFEGAMPPRPLSERENWTKADVARYKLYAHNVMPAIEALCLSRARELGKDTGDMIVGDKWPYYFDEISAATSELFTAKYIHITRHPFDAINSMMRRTESAKAGKDNWGGKTDLTDMIDDWCRAFRRVNEISAWMPTLHLIYEGLVFDAEREHSLIRNFLQRPLRLEHNVEREREKHFDRKYLSGDDLQKIREAGAVDQYLAHLKNERPRLHDELFGLSQNS